MNIILCTIAAVLFTGCSVFFLFCLFALVDFVKCVLDYWKEALCHAIF